MATEIAVAMGWIYSTLSGDTTLQGYAPGGVWRAEAPPSTTAPFVVLIYQPNQSKDEFTFGGARAYSDLYFEVFAVGPGKSTQTIANAAARLDTLLSISQQTSISVPAGNGTLLASFRDRPIESDPLVDGEVWTNIGGLYRVMLKAS